MGVLAGLAGGSVAAIPPLRPAESAGLRSGWQWRDDRLQRGDSAIRFDIVSEGNGLAEEVVGEMMGASLLG
jgi:hypothetical protein